jgi:hypothetical protein
VNIASAQAGHVVEEAYRRIETFRTNIFQAGLRKKKLSNSFCRKTAVLSTHIWNKKIKIEQMLRRHKFTLALSWLPSTSHLSQTLSNSTFLVGIKIEKHPVRKGPFRKVFVLKVSTLR